MQYLLTSKTAHTSYDNGICVGAGCMSSSPSSNGNLTPFTPRIADVSAAQSMIIKMRVFSKVTVAVRCLAPGRFG